MPDFEDDPFDTKIHDGSASKRSVRKVKTSSERENTHSHEESSRRPRDTPRARNVHRNASSEIKTSVRRNGTSSRSLDGALDGENVPSSRNGSHGARSVVSSASDGRVRRSRRESMTGLRKEKSCEIDYNPTKKSSASDVDYGYGDSAPSSKIDYGYGESNNDNVDYGYGEACPAKPQPKQQQEQLRPRRQRRCSIAEATGAFERKPSSDSIETAPESDATNTLTRSGSFRNLGASQSISNIAIPMANMEEKKPKARRASLIGGIGGIGGIRSKSKDNLEVNNDVKKKGADRDRRRQGTLMDRVGVERPSQRTGVSSSYSDRILQK